MIWVIIVLCCIAITCAPVAFILGLVLIIGINLVRVFFPDSEDVRESEDYFEVKPWDDIAPDAPDVETLDAMEYLRSELNQLNELRDIVLEKYHTEPRRQEQNLRKLITLDNKIHNCEKKLRNLEDGV